MMSRNPTLGQRVILAVLAAILTVLGSQSLLAQATTGKGARADEQALRALIRQENEGKDVIKFTDDAIFVSGAYPRPIIGRQQHEAARPTGQEIANERPNETTKNDVKRLVVSQSRDMAYEFGDFTIRYDAPNKTRTGFDGSYLRVWRKMGDEWKVDAFFARPNQP